MMRPIRWFTAVSVLVVVLATLAASASAQQQGFQFGPVRIAAVSQQIAPTAPRVPFPPLTPDEQKYLDEVLKYWEFSSNKIELYRCQFQRWEYDPVFGPRDTFKTYSAGEIRYEKPDKGLFKVEKIVHYTPPRAQGEQPQYVERPDVYGEHWICDGKSIFEFDYQKKRLVERALPPEMQGKSIVDGPLPFLFGAEAEKIKQRFWIHVITPAEAKGEYWLEAFPKTREDAANYKMVHVIIDEKDYLPKAIRVFDRNFDPRTNNAYTTFMFDKREVINPRFDLEKLAIWKRAFYRPSTPSGWERVVE
jgi:TIGR03009 family protein